MAHGRIETDEEWRGLIRRLAGGDEPVSPTTRVAPAFGDATERNRVGLVVSRAVVGEPLYRLYRLYLGEPPPPDEM